MRRSVTVNLIFLIIAFVLAVFLLFRLVSVGSGAGRINCRVGYLLVSPLTLLDLSSWSDMLSKGLTFGGIDSTKYAILYATCPVKSVSFDLSNVQMVESFVSKLYSQGYINETVKKSLLNEISKNYDDNTKRAIEWLAIGYYTIQTYGEAMGIRTDIDYLHYMLIFENSPEIKMNEADMNCILQILKARDRKTPVLPKVIQNSGGIDGKKVDYSVFKKFGVSSCNVNPSDNKRDDIDWELNNDNIVKISWIGEVGVGAPCQNEANLIKIE